MLAPAAPPPPRSYTYAHHSGPVRVLQTYLALCLKHNNFKTKLFVKAYTCSVKIYLASMLVNQM